MTDLSGSSEAKTTTFAHPLGLKQNIAQTQIDII
jgi:hypothetical protein